MRRSGNRHSDTMDLFDYAKRQKAENQPPPPPLPDESQPQAEPSTELEPASTTEDPVQKEVAAPLFRRSIESGKPITGVLEPLSRGRIPLWADRDRKRRIVLTASATAVVLVFIFLIGLARWNSRTRTTIPETGSTHIPTPEPSPRTERISPAVPSRAPDVSRAPAAAQPVRSTGEPALKAPGAIVKTQGDVQIVTFESGIFLGGTRLSPGGRRILDALGRQLAPYGNRLSITIIGCTDNVPINLGGRYTSNQELGLARANEVAQHWQRTTTLPARVFHTSSYGERWTPYPNDTPENRAKNRTAVIRISVR